MTNTEHQRASLARLHVRAGLGSYLYDLAGVLDEANETLTRRSVGMPVAGWRNNAIGLAYGPAMSAGAIWYWGRP